MPFHRQMEFRQSTNLADSSSDSRCPIQSTQYLNLEATCKLMNNTVMTCHNELPVPYVLVPLETNKADIGLCH